MKYKVAVNAREFDVDLLTCTDGMVEFAIGTERYQVAVSPAREMLAREVAPGSQAAGVPASSRPISAGPKAQGGSSGAVRAPMPGVIVSVAAQAGNSVTIGEVLLVMEAMKMENNIVSQKSGTIAAVLVKPGQQVENGQELVIIG